MALARIKSKHFLGNPNLDKIWDKQNFERQNYLKKHKKEYRNSKINVLGKFPRRTKFRRVK